MVLPIPHRRPFLGRLKTSFLKRRFRLNCWMARCLGQKKFAPSCRYFGAKFRIHPGELISDEIAINRIEWREITMMLAACREYLPDLFIDVGANVGLYSCILGKAGVVPRVVAYEPDRRNLAHLVENVECNELARIVQLRPCAVGARLASLPLQLGPPENAGLSKIVGSASGDYDVDVVALDDELNIRDSIIAIKIDVEGYELDVLSGAARLFTRNGGYAQIEAHGEERAGAIRKRMTGFGWKFIDRCNLDLWFERPGPLAKVQRP